MKKYKELPRDSQMKKLISIDLVDLDKLVQKTFYLNNFNSKKVKKFLNLKKTK